MRPPQPPLCAPHALEDWAFPRARALALPCRVGTAAACSSWHALQVAVTNCAKPPAWHQARGSHRIITMRCGKSSRPQHSPRTESQLDAWVEARRIKNWSTMESLHEQLKQRGISPEMDRKDAVGRIRQAEYKESARIMPQTIVFQRSRSVRDRRVRTPVLAQIQWGPCAGAGATQHREQLALNGLQKNQECERGNHASGKGWQGASNLAGGSVKQAHGQADRHNKSKASTVR